MLESALSALGLSQLDLLVTAASALVVTLIVLVAYAAGFRAVARLTEPELAKLAAAEGAEVEAALIEPKGRAALAQLTGGRLLLARVMGDNVGARVANRSAARVRLRRNRITVGFGDPGFPPLSWRLQADAPGWLQDLARE